MPSYREDLKQVCAEYRKCLRRCRRLRVDALGKNSRPYVMTPDQDQALRDLKWVMMSISVSPSCMPTMMGQFRVNTWLMYRSAVYISGQVRV
jgi:hypothetical protein